MKLKDLKYLNVEDRNMKVDYVNDSVFFPYCNYIRGMHNTNKARNTKTKKKNKRSEFSSKY